jgi:predicted nucleic acid-binding protein
MFLDSDVLIDVVRGHAPAHKSLAEQAQLPSICGVAVLELAFGCRTDADLGHLRRFLAPFQVIWPAEEDFLSVYRHYAPLRLAHGIGLLDRLPASVAIRANEPLGTFNARHFRSIPSLIVVQPYVR